MKLLFIQRSESDGWYIDTLRQRGHEVIRVKLGEQYSSILDDYIAHCDGLVMLGHDEASVKIAEQVEEVGKPVWCHLADVPV